MSVLVINTSFSQNNTVIVYSQDGFKFSLILNGVLQNERPSTNVKVTGLNAANYDAKVLFENKMPDINEKIYLMYGGNLTLNTEYSYAIKNVNDKFKLKFRGIAPIPVDNSQVPDPQQTTVIYSATPPVSTTTTTTNIVETTTGMPGNPGGISINFNVNDPNVINAESGSVTTTYSTTTTTTTTGTGAGMNTGNNNYNYPNNNNNNNNEIRRDDDRHRDNDNHREDHHNNNAYVLPGYTGVYGCPYPMGESDFESAKQSISAKSFDDTRLTLAKEIVGSNCLLCSQIRELMNLMSFEATKLELAKFSWHHNLDKGNYYKLNDAFTFESSTDELNKYIQSHK